MKLVKTMLIPYFKRFWLMLLSIVLVGGFGCGILIGLRNAYHSLEKNVNSLIAECGYPDLYAQTIEEVDYSYLDELPDDFNEYMHLEKAEYRIAYTTTFVYQDESYSVKLIGYDENSVLKHHAVNGEIKEGSVLLEYYFSKSNGLEIGNVLKAKMPDGTHLDYEVNATVVSPEASMVKADPYSIASSRDFAYLYVPRSTLDEHYSKKCFNEILFNYENGYEKDIDQTMNSLKEYIKEKTGLDIKDDDIKELKKNIAYATTYNESEPIKFYNDALTAVNLITILAPSVFFFVVLIVTALFLSQIIKQCRKDIGIMRACGEKISSISLVFLSLGVLVGLFAWIVGMGLGSLFTIIANSAYGSALKLFPQPFLMHPWTILIALAIIIFVTFITSFLASLSISRFKPVEAMKALPPTSNETPFLTRTVFKKTPITLKVSISQTLRNITRYLLSGLCLLSSGMLVFVALSIGESKNTMMSQLFETRLNYDVQVYFDNMPSEKDIELKFSNDENILDKTFIKYLPSEITNTTNKKKITALVNGIKSDQDLIRVVDDYAHTISIPKRGIVLSSYHAYLLDAKVGDILELDSTRLKVSSISNEYLYQVSYTNFSEYSPDFSRGSLLVKVKDQHAFFEKYKEVDHVTYISFNDVIKGEFDDRLAAFEISSRILTAMSIIIGFMIVFNMMQTNLKEQKRTFATMRTLGYQRSAISSSYLFISLNQYVVAMIFAIPIGIFLSKGLLKAISVPNQVHPFPRTWVMYVLSVVLVLAFLLVSHFLAMRPMKKWNLPESVKERE